MVSRREFLTQTAAAGLAAATAGSVAQVAACTAAPKPPLHPPNVAPTAGSRLRVIRREETTLRLGGVGDNWHMSWAADDRQYVSLCDGFGWPGLPGYDPGVFHHSRLYAIRGTPPDVTFEYLPGYPAMVPHADRTTRQVGYYNYGTLALDGRIYQFLSTRPYPPPQPEGRPSPAVRYDGAKLIYSPDRGRTWYNQDGSTPVVWESWAQRSRDNLVFFEEPQDAFSLLTILQMGRNYEQNRDGYVYGYAPNGNTEGTMNELVMFRVPKAQLLRRGAYEYFAGRRPDGTARWTTDITARAVVHTFPRGWVNAHPSPKAWHPSVVYNAPLGLYLMANWGMGLASDGTWFGKPSYLGFWTAPEPWGPWTQIHEETAWMPANDPIARAYMPQIAPKWIAADGKSFWLVWSDHQSGTSSLASEGEVGTAAALKRRLPYYGFNTQRVDLVGA